MPELDAILIPVSGGGMIAGNAIAAKAIKPDIKSKEYFDFQKYVINDNFVVPIYDYSKTCI